jgi:hypothetical protein
VIEPAQGNAKLQEAVQICQGTLALNPREKSPQDWATTQNILGLALWDLGRRSGGEEGRKLLGEAVAFLTRQGQESHRLGGGNWTSRSPRGQWRSIEIWL